MARTRHIWFDSKEILWNGRTKQTYVEAVTGSECQNHAWEQYAASPQAAEDKVIEVPAEPAAPFAWYVAKGEDVSQRPLCMVQAGQSFDLEAARARFDKGIAFACTYHACTWGSDYLDIEGGQVPKDLRPGGSFEE